MKYNLKEVLKQLAEMNSEYADWDEQLDLEQKELVNQGMDFFDAMEEVGSMRNKSIREGNSLVDFNKLNRLLDELCMVYLTGEKKERDLIVMYHEFIAEYPNKKEYITSTLVNYSGSGNPRPRSEGLPPGHRWPGQVRARFPGQEASERLSGGGRLDEEGYPSRVLP